MRFKFLIFFLYINIFLYTSVFAQNHISVSLENQIYYFLEQMEIKGICPPLSGVKPYTRNYILETIEEILFSDKADLLGSTEKKILEQYMEEFSKPREGLDLQRGIYNAQTVMGKNDTLFSANIGVNLDLIGSAGFYPSLSERHLGNDIWGRVFFNGDIGDHVSLEVSAEAGIVKSPRKYLGAYNTYYEGYHNRNDNQNQLIDVYSEPLNHFPYTYKKRWDGSIHFLNALNDFSSWPDDYAIGYNLLSEITSSFLDNKFIFRVGRLNHEWGSTSLGSSLVLNQMSRPFLGIETEFKPFSWFNFASMTGFLEFYNTKGEKTSGMTFQNAYSITMVQLKFKNYLFLDVAETVVWPKRFELGYLFPLVSSVMYKGNVGDFDNLGIFINFKAQYPGIGNIWASLFWDEARINQGWDELDRNMLAIQAGVNLSIPFLSFSSIKMSYTKVNPYCYSHTRIYTPWYGEITMEESYVNNGVSLGYYLPPNSDELMISFKTMPLKNLTTHFQYQLIRHGADFGSSAVDGSSLYSELDPDGRDDNPVLKRFFLQDGAYQWNHIIKAGLEWKMPVIPVALFLEGGINISYFTNIFDRETKTIAIPANVEGKAYPYKKIDTAEYPKSAGFIMKLGIRIFPR